MTTSIDQARAVLNSHSYPDKQQFIAQFSDAIIDQLSPEERLSAWTLGKSIRAFDQKELLCWGDTHVKANALALKLFGLNMDGRRITNEELPNSESRRWLMRSVHGRPTLPLPSGYYSERFLVASLLVSQWLRRNGTEHHMDAFKSFVWDQTLRVRWTARSEDILAEGVAQGLLPWTPFADDLFKRRFASCDAVQRDPSTRALSLVRTKPEDIDIARKAIGMAGPLSELHLTGWSGEDILSLLLDLPREKREAIQTLELTKIELVCEEDFQSMLQLLPRLQFLNIGPGSAMQDWSDFWEILRNAAPQVRRLQIGGGCAHQLHEHLAWISCKNPNACVPDDLRAHHDALSAVARVLLQASDLSLWQRLSPQLQEGILGAILPFLANTLGTPIEKLIRLKDACADPTPRTVQLFNSTFDILLRGAPLPLTGGVLDADESRSVTSFLMSTQPKSLRLKGDWNDQGYTLSQHLSTIPPLDALVLDNIRLDSPAFKALRSITPSLTSLEIENWLDGQESLIELLSECIDLRSLTLSGCRTLNPDIYKTLDAHCPELRALELRDCPSLAARSFWSPLGLPSSCIAPATILREDRASILKLALMIQQQDPWIRAHLPLVKDLLASIPIGQFLDSYFSDPCIKGQEIASVFTLCTQMRPLNCKPLISALQQRLSQLPELELKGPLNFQVLKWLSDVPALSGTLAIHSFDAADIPLLIKYPICAKRLVLPDTSLSPVEAEDLLTAGFPLIQSQDGSLWHQPWRDLPEDLRTTNLLSAMTGEEGERYRLHVALSFLTRAIEHRHSPTGADYDKLLQDNLNEEAVQGAFYLLNNDQKSQAWHSIQSLPHLRRHLIKTVQVSSRGKCFDIPPIALMGLSPRIEEEVRAQGWYWIPNASVSNTQATADLLDYAQHQRIPQAPRQVKDLFILAHHYGVASLLRPCEQRLCDAWFGEKELAYLAQNYPMPLYKERCASLMQGKARSSDAAT